MVVHIKAASLNYRDLLTRGDVAGIRQGLVPLSDAAGTVVAVGRDVTRWQLGDRVSPAFFPTWLAGQFSTAHLAHALGGGGTDGVLADHVLADASALVAVAAHLTDVEAATLPCAGLTAWHALFDRGNSRARGISASWWSTWPARPETNPTARPRHCSSGCNSVFACTRIPFAGRRTHSWWDRFHAILCARGPTHRF